MTFQERRHASIVEGPCGDAVFDVGIGESSDVLPVRAGRQQQGIVSRQGQRGATQQLVPVVAVVVEVLLEEPQAVVRRRGATLDRGGMTARGVVQKAVGAHTATLPTVQVACASTASCCRDLPSPPKGGGTARSTRWSRSGDTARLLGVSRPEDPSPVRKITGRLVRPGEDVDQFDIEFWRAMTGEQRVEALWGMTLDAIAIKGGNPDDQPRLQRSVGRIVRP